MRDCDRYNWDIGTENCGFFTGWDEPMNTHRNTIRPGNYIYCAPPAGRQMAAALNLTGNTPQGREVAMGAVLPLTMNCEQWGGALLWNPGEHCVEVVQGGLYYASWHVPVASNGLWPVIICLEDMNGRILATSANCGTMIAGSGILSLAAGARLRLVNRSGGGIVLAELCSSTVKSGAAMQMFMLR